MKLKIYSIPVGKKRMGRYTFHIYQQWKKHPILVIRIKVLMIFLKILFVVTVHLRNGK